MELDKCDFLVINALFSCGLPYKVGKGQQVVEYYAKGRPVPSLPSGKSGFSHVTLSGSGSSEGSWNDEFPLHGLAKLGQDEGIKAMLKQGVDPNQPDKDSWTPLHYAAWY